MNEQKDTKRAIKKKQKALKEAEKLLKKVPEEQQAEIKKVIDTLNRELEESNTKLNEAKENVQKLKDSAKEKKAELVSAADEAKRAAKEAKEEANRISKEAMGKINEIKKGQKNVRNNVEKLKKLKEKLESEKITQKEINTKKAKYQEIKDEIAKDVENCEGLKEEVRTLLTEFKNKNAELEADENLAEQNKSLIKQYKEMIEKLETINEEECNSSSEEMSEIEQAVEELDAKRAAAAEALAAKKEEIRTILEDKSLLEISRLLDEDEEKKLEYIGMITSNKLFSKFPEISVAKYAKEQLIEGNIINASLLLAQYLYGGGDLGTMNPLEFAKLETAKQTLEKVFQKGSEYGLPENPRDFFTQLKTDIKEADELEKVAKFLYTLKPEFKRGTKLAKLYNTITGKEMYPPKRDNAERLKQLKEQIKKSRLPEHPVVTAPEEEAPPEEEIVITEDEDGNRQAEI